MHQFPYVSHFKGISGNLNCTAHLTGPQLCWDFSVGLLFMDELPQTLCNLSSALTCQHFGARCDYETKDYQDVCGFISKSVG